MKLTAISTISPASFVRVSCVSHGPTIRRDPQHAISLDAWERLHDARDARGRRFKVHKLPIPGPLAMTAREARGVSSHAGSCTAPRGPTTGGEATSTSTPPTAAL